MTTLIAYQGDGWSVMGCDSRATDEAGNIMDLATPKIIENGQYLIAIAGSSRGGNIAQFGWKPPVPPRSNNWDVLDKFITTKFIPSLRKAFQAAGFDAKDDGDYAQTDSVFLISFNGHIYWINDDYSWDRDSRGIYHQGSGGIVAAAAADALKIQKTKTPEAAEKIIQEAVLTATKWDVYSNPPIVTAIQFTK
jgi:ATP-dependent protease HslVU (ClpYQ) peptidase subunit